MSVLNQSGEEQVVECPLCMELLEVDDLHFYPCTCGYQICRFCWNRLLESENGLCPACRKAYPENPADFTPLSQEQVAAIKTEKKAREQKRRNKTMESRKALANVRVVQNNLVFVVGLPVRLADPEVLKRQEYFGKYGKIHKVVINQSTAYAGSQGPSASAYVTYVSPADALRAIQGVNNVTLDGRVLKGSLGTTKYCANFMKNQPCPKPDCMYLHEQGDPNASFTKEEMHAGLHQVYERKLHNQLLAAQRDKPDAHSSQSTGNSSTNAEKGSSKDGNQSNYIPTTVVTSSHINVVNSSKSKKESSNGSGSSGSGSGSGKEAWPSLGSSPPSDSPARKQSSPKPPHNNVNKSQENGTSESSSPTQPQASPQQSTHNKNKDTHTADNGKSRNSNSKKNKSENKTKQKNSNSVTNNDTHEPETPADKPTQQEAPPTQPSSVFDTYNYLSNELDELESDRHSLLENHDLLDNSDHSLLEDDSRNFLNDANNEVLMMQRHREMLADLVDNHHMMPKRPLTNGYGLDRDMSYLANDRPISQISQGIMEQKEMLIRERNRELLMRQNEMLARHSAMVEPKHFMPTSSIGLDSTSELLGANYHQNPNMLPFGMRIDNSLGGSSMPTNLSAGNIMNIPTNNMATNTLSTMNNSLGANNVNTMFLLRNQQLMQQNMQQSGMANGFDSAQIAQANETRYQADNMDKFFTDFHKGQQMRLLLGRSDERRFPTHNMLSAERLEMEHKHRMGSIRGNEGNGSRAAGDGDDDLDFDPFKETQKAFAEMMESEMMQNNVSGGDSERGRHARFPPPGFGSTGFGMQPRPNIQHHTQGFNSNSAMYSDWTQMDPAIMSTSVSYSKPQQHQPQPQPQQQLGTGLTQQQQELFARFNQMNVQPNGVNKVGVPLMHQWASVGVGASQKLGWAGTAGGAGSFPGLSLPPGFAGVPAKPPGQHTTEIIDAK